MVHFSRIFDLFLLWPYILLLLLSTDGGVLVVVESGTGKVLIRLIGRPLVNVSTLVAAIKLVALVNQQPLHFMVLSRDT